MDNTPYEFEAFTSFRGKYTPKITLGKSGGFGFSSGFYNRYSLDKAKSLKLFYDRTKRAVGFIFSDNEESGSVKLKPRGGSGGYVAATSFLHKYDIDPAKYAGRYDPIEVSDSSLGKLYVIELKSVQEKNT